MKRIFLILLFIPSVTLAWENHCITPPPTEQPPIIAPTPIIPNPPPVIYPIENNPLTSPPPFTIPPSSGGENGQIWCSGPSAPGWDMNLPGGGCTTTVTLTQIPSKTVKPPVTHHKVPKHTKPKPMPKHLTLPLSALPSTGIYLNPIEYIWALLTNQI